MVVANKIVFISVANRKIGHGPALSMASLSVQKSVDKLIPIIKNVSLANTGEFIPVDLIPY
jgi:hypothetical protein